MKICTVFISKPDFEAGHPYIGFDNEEYKRTVLERLRVRFRDLELVDEEIIIKYNKDLMKKIKEDLKECDGLLVYTIGQYGDPGIVDAGVELIELNVPTVLANYPYGGDPVFLQICNRIKGKGYRVLPVSSPDFEDVEKAIDMLRRILSIKGKKVLLYTLDEKTGFNLEGLMELVSPDMGKPRVEKMIKQVIGREGGWSIEETYIDLVGTDQAHSWRRNEEIYRKNLEEVFGVEVIRRHPGEILEYYRKVDLDEVRRIVEEWKKNAKAIRSETAEKAIENAARLYLASKELMKRHGADAISFDCGTLFLTGNMPAFPCFAFSRLMDEGYTGICEADLDSGISALFVRHLFDKPSIMTNHSLDTVHNRVTYMHCFAPTRMFGLGGEPLPYEIERHGESHGMGAVPFVEFPVGETLTTIKISVLKKKIAVRTGRIIGMVRDEKACRVKVLVESDAKKILENYDWDTFGFHRVSFLGDHRHDIISAARLAGLEVSEEDR
ncbi:MAG: hypothetical protein FGF53_04200 [Candidatus Brockarchaeota archaeon]|nr:hypothetical protein [Candidatus Brockarchaeota archaeon]MBO3809324.1 hypothetical protein [Candidatus Brockarchaeota archaeon]